MRDLASAGIAALLSRGRTYIRCHSSSISEIGSEKRKRPAIVAEVGRNANGDFSAGSTGRVLMDRFAPDAAGGEVAGSEEAGTGWFYKPLPTSLGEIVIKQTVGEGLPILLLGRASHSRCDDAPPSGLGQDYRLLEMDLAAFGRAGFASSSSTAEAISTHSELAMEVLELLAIEHVVVLDWTTGGRVGWELMAIFPGVVGLVVVETAPSQPEIRRQNAFTRDDLEVRLQAEIDPTPTSPSTGPGAAGGRTAVAHVDAFDDRALSSFMRDMEMRVEVLLLAPQLWFGG